MPRPRIFHASSKMAALFFTQPNHGLGTPAFCTLEPDSRRRRVHLPPHRPIHRNRRKPPPAWQSCARFRVARPFQQLGNAVPLLQQNQCCQFRETFRRFDCVVVLTHGHLAAAPLGLMLLKWWGIRPSLAESKRSLAPLFTHPLAASQGSVFL